MEYIDLGLPSGTLWSDENEEGYYTFDEAVSKYDNSLPTREQWEELMNQCKWTWNGSGYAVTGPNGNNIVLPAAGHIGCYGTVSCMGYGFYWSSTPNESNTAWLFYFNSDSEDLDISYSVFIRNNYRYNGTPVRLVK